LSKVWKPYLIGRASPLASAKKKTKAFGSFLIDSKKERKCPWIFFWTHAFYKSDEEGVGARWGHSRYVVFFLID
jgi:hypothetical protein